MKEEPITISSYSIVRNPYERLVRLYLDSWIKIGFGAWLASHNIKPQADLLKTTKVLHAETLATEVELFELDPSEFKAVPPPIEGWQRWYDDALLEQVEPIVKKDLLTFGYYRFQK
jgi:hypothetical protein